MIASTESTSPWISPVVDHFAAESMPVPEIRAQKKYHSAGSTLKKFLPLQRSLASQNLLAPSLKFLLALRYLFSASGFGEKHS